MFSHLKISEKVEQHSRFRSLHAKIRIGGMKMTAKKAQSRHIWLQILHFIQQIR